MHLDARLEKAVERGDAVRRVLADKRAASRRVARMQRYAQRGDALLDDARLVFHREIRQGDERARQKAQAEIVVAQRERGAHVRRQLPHEAERAGVAAKLHAIEQHAFEGEAPILPEGEAPVLPLLALELDHAALSVKVDVAHLDDVAIGQPPPIDDVAQGVPVDARQIAALLALELDHAALSVKVDVAHLDDVAIGQPPPIDDVAQGVPVDARQIAARLEPRVVGRRRGRHLHDTRPRTGLEMVA